MFEIQPINGALFLKTNFFSPNALSFAALVAVALATVLLVASKSLALNNNTAIFPFTTIYASLKSRRYDLSLGVLIIIYLLTLQVSSSVRS